MKTCTNCGKENNDGMLFCGYCGSKLQTDDIAVDNSSSDCEDGSILQTDGIAVDNSSSNSEDSLKENNSFWNKLKVGAGKVKKAYDDYKRTSEENAGRLCRNCGAHITSQNIIERQQLGQEYTKHTRGGGTDSNGNETYCTITYSNEKWKTTTRCPQCGKLNTITLSISYAVDSQTQNRYGAIISSGLSRKGRTNAKERIAKYFDTTGNLIKASKEAQERSN